MDARAASVETEFSIAWIASNPELFEHKYNEFFNLYGNDYLVRAEARKGFLKLIAEKERMA